jgi:hypothetical protein
VGQNSSAQVGQSSLSQPSRLALSSFRVLRQEAIKQVVVFTHRIGKQGVKKELAIGSVVSGRPNDPKFMIPIRADDVRFGDAPPEFIRGNILKAQPNWHDCLTADFLPPSCNLLQSTLANSRFLQPR